MAESNAIRNSARWRTSILLVARVGRSKLTATLRNIRVFHPFLSRYNESSILSYLVRRRRNERATVTFPLQEPEKPKPNPGRGIKPFDDPTRPRSGEARQPVHDTTTVPPNGTASPHD